MTWVYFLREKSKTLLSFKKFKALDEKQSGRSIKTIQTDRGKEFIITSKELKEYCENEGIWSNL